MQDLLLESVKYMILGMGIVYLLLLLIVFLTKLQSRIITKYFTNKASVEQVRNREVKVNDNEDKAVVAVITAAITAYRKGR